MEFKPTLARDHHRHVHVTEDPSLMEAEAWEGVRKPDVVIYAPNGIEEDKTVVVFDGDDPLQEFADYQDDQRP